MRVLGRGFRLAAALATLALTVSGCSLLEDGPVVEGRRPDISAAREGLQTGVAQ